MATAQGTGRKIDGGGLGVPAYARVYAFLKPITVAEGAAVAGTYDTTGRYPHFRYKGNLNLGARSGGNQTPGGVVPRDFMPNFIEVEFDLVSCFTLPFDGQLEIVGGLGEWKFGVQIAGLIDPGTYEPELRTLRTLVPNASTFTVPDNHTYIYGVNQATAVMLPGVVQMDLSSVAPGTNIIPGTQITGGARDTWLLTGWRG